MLQSLSPIIAQPISFSLPIYKRSNISNCFVLRIYLDSFPVLLSINHSSNVHQPIIAVKNITFASNSIQNLRPDRVSTAQPFDFLSIPQLVFSPRSTPFAVTSRTEKLPIRSIAAHLIVFKVSRVVDEAVSGRIVVVVFSLPIHLPFKEHSPVNISSNAAFGEENLQELVAFVDNIELSIDKRLQALQFFHRKFRSSQSDPTHKLLQTALDLRSHLAVSQSVLQLNQRSVRVVEQRSEFSRLLMTKSEFFFPLHTFRNHYIAP